MKQAAVNVTRNNRWISRGIATGSAILLTVGLLSFLIIVSESDLLKPASTTIREVKFALPPPPPPPPPTHAEQPAETPSLDISIGGDGPSLKTSKMILVAEVDVAELEPPEPKAMTPDWDSLLQPNWDAVGLDELDTPPRMITNASNLKINYPTSLVRQGINTVELELDVMIDETGKVFLRQILGSPPPEIISPVKKIIERARFTAPLKDGVAVRASFIWPLEFSK